MGLSLTTPGSHNLENPNFCDAVDKAFRTHINLKVLRLGMMAYAVSFVMGCVFLLLSNINVIQIRLDMLSCESKYVIHSITGLVVLVFSALVVYISIAIYAI